LSVSGVATLASTLLVQNGGVGITGASIFHTSLTSSGAFIASSTLGVSGVATLASTLLVQNGGIGVTGASIFHTSLTSSGALTASSTLGVSGVATLASTLLVQNGGIGVTGASIFHTSLTSSGALTASSTLGVTGVATLASNVNITGGGLGVTGGVTFHNTTVSGSTTTGALVVRGGVGIGGSVNIGGWLFVDRVYMSDNTTGGFYLSGSNTAHVFRNTNGFLIAGISASSLTMYTATNATSTTTGAIIIDGGIGIGMTAFVGGSLALANGSQYFGFRAGASSGSFIWTLPTNDGTSGQALVTNGSGQLSFTTITSGGGGAGTVLNGTSATIAYYIGTGTTVIGAANFQYNNSSVSILHNTNSTSSTSGALIVTGGLGVSGNTRIGGGLGVSGALVFNSGTFGNTGSSTFSFNFISSGNSPISLNVLSDNSLSFEGSSGQLFSIDNNLTSGTIFSVNDVSGVPFIRVDATGVVGLAEYGGNVGVGTTNPQFKLDVNGSIGASGAVTISNVTNATSTATGALIVTGGAGIGKTLVIGSALAFASGANWVGFRAGTLSGSIIWTLPTGDGTNGQVLTTNGSGVLSWGTGAGAGSSGIQSLNGLTASTQSFAVGSGGSSFNISSATSTHTFNIPNASVGEIGLVTTSAQTFAGVKSFNTSLLVTSGGIGITGASTFHTSLTSAGALTASSTLSVSGVATLSSNVNITAGGLGVTGGFTVSGASVFGSTSSFAGVASHSAALLVTSGGIGITGVSIFHDATNSTSATTGAVIVSGGVGIGKSVFVGGSLALANGSQYFGFRAGASSGSYIWTLPIIEGTSGQVLTTNGSGVLSWATASGSGGTAIVSLNSLVATTQTFAVGTGGSSFNISSASSTHTFNIPNASVGEIGLVTTTAQTFAGVKSFNTSLLVTSGGIGITGASIFHTSLTSSGALTASSTLGVSGVATLASTLLVQNGGIGVTGASIFHTSLTSSGALTASSTLSVSGVATLSSNVNITSGGLGVTGGLTVSGATVFNSNTNSTSSTTGAVTLVGGLGISGNLNIGSGLGVSGVATFGSTSSFAGVASFSAALLVTSGGIGITGASTFHTSLTSSGVLTVSNTTAATSSTNAALVISGGVGVGGSIIAGTIALFNGANYVGFRAPALSASRIWTLPAADGSNGQVLTTDGSGNLSWGTGAGAGTSGITSLNGLSATTQTFAVGTSGSSFNISSVSSTHTFNIPNASVGEIGLVTTTAQTFAGVKSFNTSMLVTSGGIGVTGASTFHTSLTSAGALTASSTLGVSGVATLASTLLVQNGGIGVTGASIFHTSLTSSGAFTASSTLGVSGVATLASTLLVQNGGVGVTGASIFHTSLTS
jgi:hypothetical protein